jgi:hypothetical protein
LAWLTGYPREKVNWHSTIDPAKYVKCGMRETEVLISFITRWYILTEKDVKTSLVYEARFNV